MLRMSLGVTRKDRMRNDYIRKSLNIKEDIRQKVQNERINWYEKISDKDEINVIKKAIEIPMSTRRTRGKPQNTWLQQIKRHRQLYGNTENEHKQLHIIEGTCDQMIYPYR